MAPKWAQEQRNPPVSDMLRYALDPKDQEAQNSRSQPLSRLSITVTIMLSKCCHLFTDFLSKMQTTGRENLREKEESLHFFTNSNVIGSVNFKSFVPMVPIPLWVSIYDARFSSSFLASLFLLLGLSKTSDTIDTIRQGFLGDRIQAQTPTIINITRSFPPRSKEPTE